MHKRKIIKFYSKGRTFTGTTLVPNSYGILIDDKELIPWSTISRVILAPRVVAPTPKSPKSTK